MPVRFQTHQLTALNEVAEVIERDSTTYIRVSISGAPHDYSVTYVEGVLTVDDGGAITGAVPYDSLQDIVDDFLEGV